ncbi:MAG: DUF4365 domain-containing protein [Acidobacteriota bacterium]
MSNEIGARGESLFIVLLTKAYGRKYHLFRPQFLGDKWPGIDFIIELIGSGITTAYFFVQVKTTRLGYTRKGNRLKIKVSKDELNNLASYCAPTYVVGIDEVGEKGFILSAKKRWKKGLTSLPTHFPINEDNQKFLWEEVRDYWKKSKMHKGRSKFYDLGRR